MSMWWFGGAAKAALLAGLSVSVGQVTETDTALSITPQLRRLVDQVVETDTAQSINAGGGVIVELVSESDTAFAVVVVKSLTVDIATETDTAQSVIPSKRLAVGLVTEADSALPIAHPFIVGLASEFSFALPITKVKRFTLGMATETDSAFAMTSAGAIQRILGLVIETDTALPITAYGGASPVEQWQYLELWTKLECEGGTRLGFFLPYRATRRLRVIGDDAFSTGLAKSHRLAALVAKGGVIREVLSLDGLVVREWPIESFARGDGADLLLTIECSPVLQKLVNYEVTQTDGDGFVYQDTSAIQLTPTTILGPAFIRSNTPAWLGTGIVEPTELIEVPFSGDSALSGIRRLEEVTGYDTALRKNGASGYLLDHMSLGAAAPPLYLRTGKNIKALRKEIQPGQVTRLTMVSGADGDDGPSGIAWAYWNVSDTSGAGPYRVRLAGIHGGAGPIAFDDQFNHANLPGGADSLYLEKMDGTFVQITGSFAATQELEVPSLTGISLGDWVRIVASSTGKHLTFLDAPTELAGTGIVAGRFESPWDDAVCVFKNALQIAWANPATRPDGWTGAGARTIAANESLTAGQALLVNQLFSDGAQVAAPPARAWRIQTRRANWSAVAWIRLLTLTDVGNITFQVKANGMVVGSGLVFEGPGNVWRQLKIEGLDLSAFIGTSPSLVAEIVKSNGAGRVHMITDSICLFPALAARAVTEGSNGARIWQGANQFLDERRGVQISYRVGAADLARMGHTNQQQIVLGGTAVVTDEEDGVVNARILEIMDHPEDTRETEVVLSTLPARRSRQQAKPLPLVIPYLEPVQVRVANRDTRLAALLIKATVTASDDRSVTVMLEVKDSLGGSPVVAAEVFGALLVSGSGYGPYVYLKPSLGRGAGRAVFTASLPGRDDVTDAIDIAESTYVNDLLFNECRITVVLITPLTYTVEVEGKSLAGDPTVEFVAVTGSATLASGPAIGVPSLSGTLWVFNRGAPASGLGEVRFRAVFSSVPDDDDYLLIAEQGTATTALVCRPRIVTVAPTFLVIRVSVVDPIPQGLNSATIAHATQGGALAPASVTPISGQTVTPDDTYTEAAGTYVDFTVGRLPYGSGDAGLLFTVTAVGRISDRDSVAIPEQALELVELIYSECRAELWDVQPTYVIIVAQGFHTKQSVAAVPLTSYPVVEYVGETGSATFLGGPPIGSQVLLGMWAFQRGAPASGTSRAQFRASFPGTVSDDDFVEIPAQSDATIRLLAQARVISTLPTLVIVRVLIADPVPQGADSGVVSYTNPSNLRIDRASGQTVTPEATLTEADGTYADFAISRPAVGGNPALVTFTASAASRISDVDSVSIPPRLALVYCMCLVDVTEMTATQYKITVTGLSTLGVPTVQLVSLSDQLSLASGPAPGLSSASKTRWVVNRGAVDSGTGQARFRAVLAGAQSDDNIVEIAEVGAATTALTIRARVIDSTAIDVTIRLSVADPTPQGAGSGTIEYTTLGDVDVTPVSGQTVTPAAIITEAVGTYVDFVVTRPPVGDGDGSIAFVGSAANRISDTDTVVIPEQSSANILAWAVFEGTFSFDLGTTISGANQTYNFQAMLDTLVASSGPGFSVFGGKIQLSQALLGLYLIESKYDGDGGINLSATDVRASCLHKISNDGTGATSEHVGQFVGYGVTTFAIVSSHVAKIGVFGTGEHLVAGMSGTIVTNGVNFHGNVNMHHLVKITRLAPLPLDPSAVDSSGNPIW